MLIETNNWCPLILFVPVISVSIKGQYTPWHNVITSGFNKTTIGLIRRDVKLLLISGNPQPVFTALCTQSNGIYTYTKPRHRDSCWGHCFTRTDQSAVHAWSPQTAKWQSKIVFTILYVGDYSSDWSHKAHADQLNTITLVFLYY
jgi:hypothetical protein